MEWLNIHIAQHLRSPSAIGSTPAELGTWLRVMAYCAEQENGGRITGGALWKDRQWQQLCAVTMRELRAADRLIAFDGDDVVVNGYDREKEAEVVRSRRRARNGAMARWGHRAGAQADARACARADAQASAEQEGEVEEERNRKAPASPPSPASTTPTTAPRIHRVDLIDKAQAAAALTSGDIERLLAAFGATVNRDIRDEWRRADVTGGQALYEVAAVLFLAVCGKDPIRMPSRYAKARACYESSPRAERIAAVTDCCEYIGVVPPQMKGDK